MVNNSSKTTEKNRKSDNIKNVKCINEKNTNINNKDIFNNKDIKELKILIEAISRKYNKTPFELLRIIENKILIPINIFNKNKPLTAIVTYIINNYNLNYTQTAKILNRSTKTIWQAYNKNRKNNKKQKKEKQIIKKLTSENSKYDIPIEYFYKEKLSILETIVKFLKEEHNLPFKKISLLIQRNQRTIWTIYARATKKEKNIAIKNKK
ncbi:MAG: hypothetical protein QXG00_01775 [Candidatus Woesearchaeota archaeon]